MVKSFEMSIIFFPLFLFAPKELGKNLWSTLDSKIPLVQYLQLPQNVKEQLQMTNQVILDSS
jgi:hypothetical protein